MRHRIKGRILGRTASHRHAMWRNMASSLFLTLRSVEDVPSRNPKVPGRIVTTVAKAKEVKPYIEKLVTLARHAIDHEEEAARYGTSAARNSQEWKTWRESPQWNKWNQAIAPAVTARRKAFALLRDPEAVQILFSEVGPRFRYRNGGYLRVVRLSQVRLGDAGPQALLEFVGERDRVRMRRTATPVTLPVDNTPEPVTAAPAVATPASEASAEAPAS